MKPPARKPKIKVIVWLAGTLLAVGCALWLAFRVVYRREVALLTAPPATVLLHSKLRYNEVVVPFRLLRNQISVQAVIDGHTTWCSMDTGTASILIPQSLHIAKPVTDAFFSSSSSATDAGGNSVEVEQAVLDDFQVAGYELRRVPALVASSTSSTHSQSIPSYGCPLGNSIFSSVVVTVDYRLHQVIFRSPEYNPATQQHLPYSLSFPFRWASSVTSERPFGLIAVSGTISGHPATFAVDTGWSSNTMGIRREAYRRSFPSSPFENRNVISTAFGQAKGVYIPDLVCSLKTDDPHHPDLKFHQPALVIPDQDDGVDAIWGYAVLKDYRVTIDYPRRRIFLEPYAAATAK